MIEKIKIKLIVLVTCIVICSVYNEAQVSAALPDCTWPISGSIPSGWMCVDVSLTPSPSSLFTDIGGVQFQINNSTQLVNNQLLAPNFSSLLAINQASGLILGTVNETASNIIIGGVAVPGFASGTEPLFHAVYETISNYYPLYSIGSNNLDFIYSDLSSVPITVSNFVLNTTYVLNNGATTILNGYPLPVTINGSGSGTVVSSPAGISCSSGTCDYPFTLGTAVILTASPVGSTQVSTIPSYRSGWAGCSSSTDSSCTISSLTTASAVSALFSLYPAKLSGQGTYYANLQAAADNAASGSTIQTVSSSSISGGLVLSANKALTITGGYDETFTTVGTTPTTLTGTMTIASGSLIIDKLAIF